MIKIVQRLKFLLYKEKLGLSAVSNQHNLQIQVEFENVLIRILVEIWSTATDV